MIFLWGVKVNTHAILVLTPLLAGCTPWHICSVMAGSDHTVVTVSGPLQNISRKVACRALSVQSTTLVFLTTICVIFVMGKVLGKFPLYNTVVNKI